MPVPVAMSLAIIIENGMNIYKSYEREQKDYHAKARQLVVNLKVRESIHIIGRLALIVLVLTPILSKSTYPTPSSPQEK